MTRAHIGHDITLALSLAAVGCGGASSPTAPSPSAAVELRGQAADAVGDAASHPTLRVAPDLVSTTIGVSGTTVTIAVRFASGTFDRAALSTQVMF